MRPFLLRASLAAVALLIGTLPATSQSPQGPGSFPLHEEFGSATLIERAGVGTASAYMVGEYTSADIREMCERVGWKLYSPSFPFRGVYEDRRTISICREREEARPLEQRRYVVMANCPQGLLRDINGYLLQRVGAEWRTESGNTVRVVFPPRYASVVTRQFELLCSASTRVTVAGYP